MTRVNDGLNNIPETGNSEALSAEATASLTFRNMLERFYLDVCPPDPSDPRCSPPANLKDRRQK